MPRTRTHTLRCTATGCTETSFAEYTAQRDLEDVSDDWKCYRHSKPNEVLSPANRETTAVLELHQRMTTDYWGNPKVLGNFWGPEGGKGTSGIESGPGFRAIGKDLPPGTRLIVTARIELPTEES